MSREGLRTSKDTTKFASFKRSVKKSLRKQKILKKTLKPTEENSGDKEEAKVPRIQITNKKIFQKVRVNFININPCLFL